MVKFLAKRVGNTLVPDAIEDGTEFAKLPIGKLVWVEARQSRSLPQLRLWWGLCRRIGAAVGVEPESVSDLLLIEAGHYDLLRSKKYGDIRRAKSISFATLDATEFNAIFDKAVDVIYTNWGIAREDVLEVVQDLLIPQAKEQAK